MSELPCRMITTVMRPSAGLAGGAIWASCATHGTLQHSTKKNVSLTTSHSVWPSALVVVVHPMGTAGVQNLVPSSWLVPGSWLPSRSCFPSLNLNVEGGACQPPRKHNQSGARAQRFAANAGERGRKRCVPYIGEKTKMKR